MNIATRTTEGHPCRCPVCGKQMSVTPGEPLIDFLCLHCGTLFYSHISHSQEVPDALKLLSERGVNAETDDEGEVIRLQFQGNRYNDRTVRHLAKLKGVPVIDISKTAITTDGAAKLRSLLPDATILH